MRFRVICCSFLLFAFTFTVEAKRVVIRATEDFLQYENVTGCKYVIKSGINLEGAVCRLASNSSLIFRKGGALTNGTIIGQNTKLKPYDRNIFTDCITQGEWDMKYSSSVMFDTGMSTLLLLKNLSHLSSHIKLSHNRNYDIDAEEQEICVSVIESLGKEKPVIRFHTKDPNIPGILLEGQSITLRNIVISDDYDKNNDALYGSNDSSNGNTLTILSKDGIVYNLIIDNCEFKGGTSSSFVASSQVRNCLIINSLFSGYCADHAVYCSIEIESYAVKNCTVRDIKNANGLFKVRASKRLRSFTMDGVHAHNLNGYIVAVSLLNTPEAELFFNDIIVTKDKDNTSVFYGFFVCNGLRSEDCTSNAASLTMSNCVFDYGYNNSLVYPGAWPDPRICFIKYYNISANASHFGGGITDSVIVTNSRFNNVCGEKGITIRTSHLNINNSELISNHNFIDHLFLINYYGKETETIRLDNVIFDINSNFLFSIVKGDNMEVSMDNCSLSHINNGVIKYPEKGMINYKQNRCVVNTNE